MSLPRERGAALTRNVATAHSYFRTAVSIMLRKKIVTFPTNLLALVWWPCCGQLSRQDR